MLEGILASVISRLAGKYVDGIDKQAAEMSVWKGEIRLRKLALKSSALDELDLPVKLVFGSLEELQLDIPWKNLRSRPVVVKITGLYMVVRPNNDPSTTAEQQQERALASKRASIAELDAAGPESGDGAEPESFSSRLVTKIVDNIQLEVRNVHIRYEDHIINPEAAFDFGIMIGRLAAESTSTNWKPSFVENQKVLYKLCSLEGLSFYVNSDQAAPQESGMVGPTGMSGRDDTSKARQEGGGYTPMLAREHIGETLATMVEKYARADAAPSPDADDDTRATGEHDRPDGAAARDAVEFVLRPIDASLKLKLNKRSVPDAQQPKYDATLEMSHVVLRLQKRQYRDLVRTLDFISNFDRMASYAQFRPSASVRANPRAWWFFAFNCLAWERNQRLGRFDKGRLFRLLVRWVEYAHLYRRKLSAAAPLAAAAGNVSPGNAAAASSARPIMTDEDARVLRELEDELSLEAITFARDAVRRKMVREAALARKVLARVPVCLLSALRGGPCRAVPTR
jgi:vacuolar protein sorting-associated protein 13A/C